MRKPTFALGAVLFLSGLTMDTLLIISGYPMLGALSMMGTLLIYACSIVWLIDLDDGTINYKNLWLALPFTLFGVSFYLGVKSIHAGGTTVPENLREVGNVMMSSFQMGLWLVCVMTIAGFIMAASLMGKRQ